MFRRLIENSKRGTAVDQWGWDSREMWAPLKDDPEVMDDMAETWALPVATGYLPPRYRDQLAGGRLIALSKHPKPGVRPICISDAIRRLVAKGLLEYCKPSWLYKFQHSHTRALQFGSNLRSGASNIFHMISGIIHVGYTHSSEDPLAVASLDIKNALNSISRAHLTEVLGSSPPTRVQSNPSAPATAGSTG